MPEQKRFVDTLDDGGATTFDARTGFFHKGERTNKKLTIFDQLKFAEALKELRVDVVKAMAVEHGLFPMESLTPLMLWVTIHKCRCGLINATAKQKRESEDWLRQHGISVSEKDFHPVSIDDANPYRY